MRAEHVIFYGPILVAVLLAVIAMIVWHRNLGSTPLVWVLIGCAILLGCLALLFPIAIWYGDI